VVREEWRYARQQGTCVIPVKGAPNLDYSSLPGWMRHAHFVDYRQAEQWTRLVRNLQSPCQAPRVPMMAAELADDFVERPAELDALISALLDETRDEPVAITAALKGAGGYGKTTLARALCHDEAVLDAFHDGVLWVTLGERPGDPMGRVQDLIEVLIGQRAGFQTLEAATTRLAELLADRRILIVVDDVWQAGDLQPFLRGGPSCARLITTRNSDTLPAGAARIPVDAMQETEAVRLLRYRLPEGENQAFERLAARLGEWPLLLKLVNGALRTRVLDAGQPLAGALAYINRALDRRGLTALDACDTEERDRAVARTLGVSLELLRKEQHARFEELAVLPQDVDVPLAAVETLWSRTADFDEFDTEDLCHRLFGLSLLWSFDLATRRLRLHDVVRGFLSDQQKGRLPELHTQLIEAYRAKCPDGWHSGPNDGYFFQSLPWHLGEAGQREELRKLLFDYTWLRAKLGTAGVNAAIEDLERLGLDAGAVQLAGTLRLSAHVLSRDAGQLAGQLIGRLANSELPELALIVKAARASIQAPALVPRSATLTPPGTGLIRTLTGHEGHVAAVAVLPNGRGALTGSSDHTARLWNLESGQELQRFAGHTDWVVAVAVLPDGKRAITGSLDRTARLWDVESGQELQRFAGHSDWVLAVATLPDGKRAITGSSDRTARMWDVESGQELRRFAGHSDSVSAVAVLPERGEALTAGDDGTVRLWDLTSGAEVRRFEGDRDWISTVTALPMQGQALSAGKDGTVRLWDLGSGLEVKRLRGHRDEVLAMAALPERGQVLTAGADGEVRLWDLASGAEVKRFWGPRGQVVGLAALGANQVLLAGQSVWLWDLDGVPELNQVNVHRGAVRAVAALARSGQALSAGSDGTVRLWDLNSGGQIKRFWGPRGGFFAIAALAEPYHALLAGSDGVLRLWELASGTEVKLFGAHDGGIGAVAVLAEGGQAITAGSDGTVRLWDLQSGGEVRRFKGHYGRVSAVALAKRGQVLTAGEDGTVRLWDLGSGKEVQRLDVHHGWVLAVASLPDQGQALTASEDGCVQLWDLERGEEVRRFNGHSGWVLAAAVLQERGQALTAGEDGTVRLWNIEAGTQIAVFTTDGAIRGLSVTQDGKIAIAGDSLGRVHALEILFHRDS
jgi:WD40 repeat protein